MRFVFIWWEDEESGERQVRNEIIEEVTNQKHSEDDCGRKLQKRRKKNWRALPHSSPKGRISDMKLIEDFESRPHKAVTFAVERGKERQEWNVQTLSKALPGYSGGRLPGRSAEEKGRDEGEEGEGSGERQVRNEIIEEVIRRTQEKKD